MLDFSPALSCRDVGHVVVTTLVRGPRAGNMARNKILSAVLDALPPAWRIRQYRDALKSDSQMRRRLIVIGISVCVAFLALYALLGGPRPSHRVVDESVIRELLANAPLVPQKIGDVEVLATNEKDVTLAEATAIVVLFHGCSNSMYTWRDAPLEREFARILSSPILHPGADKIFLVAFSSVSALSGPYDMDGGCWQQSGDAESNPDLKRSKEVIEGIHAKMALQKESPRRTPVFAFGASSGGAFVGLLATTFPDLVRALVVHISPLHPLFVQRYTLGSDKNGAVKAAWEEKKEGKEQEDPITPPPPVLFLHMKEGDQQTAHFIVSQQEEIKQAYSHYKSPCYSKLPGASHTQWRCVDELYLKPHTLAGLNFFADWMPSRITPAASKELIKALIGAGVLKISSMAAAAADAVEDAANAAGAPAAALSAAALGLPGGAAVRGSAKSGGSTFFKVVTQPRGKSVTEALNSLVGDEENAGSLIPLGLSGFFGSHARLSDESFSASSSAFSALSLTTATAVKEDRYLTYADDVLFGVAGIDDRIVERSFTDPLPPLSKEQIGKGREQLRRWAGELLNEAFSQHEFSPQHAEAVRSWILTHATAY